MNYTLSDSHHKTIEGGDGTKVVKPHVIINYMYKGTGNIEVTLKLRSEYLLLGVT